MTNKNMKHYLILFCAVVFSQTITAQQTYILKGKIEFEKTVNVHKIMDEGKTGASTAMDDVFKKSVSPIGLSYFDLYFNSDKSLYKPGKEVTVSQRAPEWVVGQSTDNIVFNDLVNQTTAAQKNVYENTYLVQDSLRRLNWKVSNDTRTIAGLECRRATAIIMDSVFVVAFFSEQIICSSGPEGFSGLPGMILGIAIPRLHTTWYATKLELAEVKDSDLAAPKKGKPINSVQLQDQLKTLFKSWSSRGGSLNRNIWQIII